jgi:hypothetical protein
MTEVVITLQLMNSAVHENPETLKRMAEDRVRHMIAMDPMLNIFVGSFQVEVRP